ncbi:SPASM domain peptide maturase, grasp-with-spasm system [Nannocystis exedens]|uniref:SPASM domain peptide maturase, grasp-with-spasm system n=1 Tax=Nannocystis exedens TaxID=54 RepID=A0A1I2CXN2_9BACT|nr:grasp-with-spasm system SPASM domain peptide maturase [Nannocystis exedens]PCC68619.1 grasp-with-spasm system SPASM domain peptide maturase [Nannocystis exedens]SFE72490.1 SPASM domain peptide maturase, grasp-with-spasm system [Nannocystis exedens]
MDAKTLLRDCLDKYVFLYSDCVPVEGYAASAIYDLTRRLISTFPSAYFPFFELFRARRLRDIVAELGPEERDDFVAFLDFLLEHEYVAVVDDAASFPAISGEWDAPCTIHNAILDVRGQHHDYLKIVEELGALGCQHLQVRSYSKIFGICELAELARLCRGSSIQTLEAVLPYDPSLRDDDYVAVVSAHRVIAGLVLHSADAERRIAVDYGARESVAKLLTMEIQLTTRPIESHLDCGHLSQRQLLPPSTPSFNELHHFNGCLNRKLSIDEGGQVRNCPAMRGSFGDHRSVSLADVVAREDFRRVWRAKNDEIQGCRDCPYRYACTGCRALLEEPDVQDSKPLKCGYDPYTDAWADWRTRANATATMARYQARLHLPIVRS